MKKIILDKGGLFPWKTTQAFYEHIKLSEEYILTMENLKETYINYREAVKAESDDLQRTIEFMERKYSGLIDTRLATIFLNGSKITEDLLRDVLGKRSKAKEVCEKRLQKQNEIKVKAEEVKAPYKKSYLDLIKYFDGGFELSKSPLFLIKDS